MDRLITDLESIIDPISVISAELGLRITSMSQLQTT